MDTSDYISTLDDVMEHNDALLPTTCILPKLPMQFGDSVMFFGKCVDPKDGSSFSVNLMRADDIMCCVDFRPLDNKVS